MMTVRFATGFSIQYNTATYAHWRPDVIDLYTEKDGRWVATVPRSVILEIVPACRTYMAQDTSSTDVANELRLLKRAVSKLSKSK